LLLSQAESPVRRVWHVVDEVKELQMGMGMGKFDALPRVATFGRGAGNRIIIGFQDIEGLRHVCGRELAHELTGQCSTKAFLRMDDPETAAWAAKVIADVEVLEKRRSGKDNNSDGNSWSEQTTKREAVLAGELLGLPPTNRRNGLTGYYLSPFTGVFRSTISAPEVDRLSVAADPHVPGHLPRPNDHQILRPFDEADFRRLGLKPSSDGPDRKFIADF
jgi:hypothetical protein